MACYISSNDNRFFVALEQSYGQVAAINGQNRIPAVRLTARQRPEVADRRDKTGSRTFAGLPSGIRRKTEFQLNTLMTAWTNQGVEPSQGPLFQAALGGDVAFFTGATVSSVTGGTHVQFAAPHGLSVGQGVTFGGEIRFVQAIANATAVVLNAPLSNTPQAGATLGGTATYRLATELRSASIFDYWGPATAVQRILNGAAVDTLRVRVNGDFHEFEFRGASQDLLDSASFTAGQGALTGFPPEPASVGFDYTIVPGHLGEVWLGTAPDRFFSVTSGEVRLDNNLDLRNREFGSDFARCISPGKRVVTADIQLFEQDDAATKELYQAARQRSPIQVMLQLGKQVGQLFGVYLPNVVAEVPEFDDSETRLQWKFENSRAQGSVNDELYIAFG